MTRHVQVEEEERIPADATVRHYDELAEPAKERLPALVDDGRGQVGPRVVADLTAGEFIKYTDYYRVETAENRQEK